MARPNREPMLTVPEVAARFNTSEATVWRMMRRGELPRVKVSDGATRIPVDAVDQLIKRRTRIAGQMDRSITAQQAPDSTGTAPRRR